MRRCTGEEGTPVILPISTSSPEATRRCTLSMPDTRELALLDRWTLETNGPSAVTEEGMYGHDPWKQTASGTPMWPNSCCHIFASEDRRRRNLLPRSWNLAIRVHQEDYLSDGVYQHLWILSPAGWLKF